MRAVVLGGNGMLGHKIWQIFENKIDTFVLARAPYSMYHNYDIFDYDRWISGMDAQNFEAIARILKYLDPNVVINCIGIVKQLPEAEDPPLAISINALFPHKLANICNNIGSRIIHISTDCVFSGRNGMYKEDDIPDPVDLYGRSKLLGEIYGENCLTIRTSFIGRELGSHNGLVEWLLNTKNQKINGYVNAIFSGFTTDALARILFDVVSNHSRLSGIYHISSEPISKYDLLQRLREAYKLDIEIEPYKDYYCNRSLDSSRFRTVTGIVPPRWDEMISGLLNDLTKYDQGGLQR
jgi:dTDP-4-dehydrorhamnose reductase